MEDGEETAKNVSGRTTEFIHKYIMYPCKQFSSFKIPLQYPHLANSWILIIESFSFLNCSVYKHGLAYYSTFPILFHTEERFQSKDQVITKQYCQLVFLTGNQCVYCEGQMDFSTSELPQSYIRADTPQLLGSQTSSVYRNSDSQNSVYS